MNDQAPVPFQLSCTPAVAELLRTLNMTLAVSTYQAGKLVFISPVDNDRLSQLPRTFSRAMAIGTQGPQMAVATLDTVELLVNDPRLAANYPPKPNTYDGLYVPRVTYYTGRIDCHGLEWGREGMWAVNTAFGCLSILSPHYSFQPKWKPPFVSAIAPEDRCHLNGVAMEAGAPRYATTLGHDDERESWRKTLPNGGTLIDVHTNEVLLSDLPMPHSPRIIDGRLYMLLSATGEVVSVDPQARTYEVIQRLDGFTRGMTYYRDHLFVALSKLRQNSSTFKDLPIAQKATWAGVVIIHLPTGAVVGQLRYHQSVDEIFDLAAIPDFLRPGIVSAEKDTRGHAVTTPETTYWAVPRDEVSGTVR